VSLIVQIRGGDEDFGGGGLGWTRERRRGGFAIETKQKGVLSFTSGGLKGDILTG